MAVIKSVLAVSEWVFSFKLLSNNNPFWKSHRKWLETDEDPPFPQIKILELLFIVFWNKVNILFNNFLLIEFKVKLRFSTYAS